MNQSISNLETKLNDLATHINSVNLAIPPLTISSDNSQNATENFGNTLVRTDSVLNRIHSPITRFLIHQVCLLCLDWQLYFNKSLVYPICS